jgi:hypothetical protein
MRSIGSDGFQNMELSYGMDIKGIHTVYFRTAPVSSHTDLLSYLDDVKFNEVTELAL